MKPFFLLIAVQFAATTLFSQATDPEIRFRYSDTITLQKDRGFSEEFLLADGKVLAIHEENRETFNFYRLNANLVVEEQVRQPVRERFFPGKELYTSWFMQMGPHIYYVFTLTEGTVYEMFATEFFPESMDFSDELTELPIDGKQLTSYKISSDGKSLALYELSDLIGDDGEEVIGLSLLVLDSNFTERGHENYTDIPTSSAYLRLLLANDGTAYMATKVYDYKKGKNLYNGETNFHFEVHAFNPATADRRTHRIDLAGFYVTPGVGADLSLSNDGAVTVLFNCTRSKKDHDAFAFIRIDPSDEQYQLADYVVELPLDVVNAGKENNKNLLISSTNLLRLQTGEHVFYASDGNAYLPVMEMHSSQLLTNEGSHLYTSIYVLRFDQNGKLGDIISIPVLCQAGDFPVRLLEVNGHIKIIYADHVENIAVNRFDDLKKARPDNELAQAYNYALVSVTLNNGEQQKQLVTNFGNLRFGIYIRPYGRVNPSSNYVLDSGRYIRMNVLTDKPFETTANIVYSICVVE